ncbi:AraC family transcriptional regulator [Streptomyces agglomeratus]|uniref:AraC family transcriptional regulator n=1 Tax=Streptomyces agglomeratus TaxID=285458 RepID=A0A1E5P4P2_9ACTN|nr:AlkA N-terminal domain-containing protein [Streptomyces agglomeratus]OEJ24437.1 AraC family transcriptional regulator [Streptomyces agglomeratus]OEJ41612.1 AraC family transcriptional regulator [Streptomyces agglomeratus]OEJ44010.1 AraC family transcriptional regulator [Streptomyces agglomeratus]OEJ54103.1 AraC family transcriptional regulator [Streptomyces agglomeratus]OEJ61475.1 AraC family transcriptional regulator [Streptomyces agglomeratus]
MDEESKYEAVTSRDARFDGEFFFAVATTGIYCRPSCPAVTPKRANVRFYPTAAAAQANGFRACRRCRPDAVPGSADWNARADVVGRAMRMIGDGIVDREGVPGLAGRLGYSTRQVQRQLTAELGAGPVALARAQRAHTARVLLQTTALPVTEIAFASGFASVRQFNDTIRQIYARTPTLLRKESGTRTAGTGSGRGPSPARAAGIPLRLAYRGVYAAKEVFDLLASEAVPRVEEMAGEPGARTYRRTLRLPYGTAIAAVDEAPHRGWLDARIHLTDLRDLTTAVQRLRRLFDLDADPYAVDERLAADPELAPLVAARPGLRSPGAADPDEFAVRAVVGPEAAAGLVETYGKVLDQPCGTLTHVFPEPGALTGAEDPVLRTLATALADGVVRLDPGADRDEAERALRALPGITARTAGLIRMRALGDPDVAPDGAESEAAGERSEPRAAAWRPWRSYAVRHRSAA